MKHKALHIEHYFESIPAPLAVLFSAAQDDITLALKKAPAFLDAFFSSYQKNQRPKAIKQLQDTTFYCEDVLELEQDWVDPSAKVFVGAGAKLEPGVLLKNRVIILPNAQIRQAAYIREDSLISSNCVVGHATEIKSSILLTHVEAGHFNYIGNSVIGSYTNLCIYGR